MFIPRGKALYENLATSYVLVDALVADLCEGGYSGVVEVTLSHAQSFVVIARGRLAAVVETICEARDSGNEHDGSYRIIALAELAQAARRERGRVSVYNYSAGMAEAIAGRLSAEPLYTGLSTEFADLEKMISKLMRERDRQWFIEVRASGGATYLAHIKDDRCRVISREDDVDEEETDDVEPGETAALRRLLDECSIQGCAFDVYFKTAVEEAQASEQPPAASEPVDQPKPETVAAEREQSQARDISTAMKEAKAIYSSLSLDDAASGLNQNDAESDLSSEAEPAPESQRGRATAETSEQSSVAGSRSFDEATGSSESAADGRSDGAGTQEDDLMVVAQEARSAGEVEPTSDAFVMAEIKRLMGDIARTVEEATRAVEQRDAFSMYLRAGQLKIAEAYPFLDPFGAEFEYLGGEIAFIGQAKPDEFIEGLTKAMKLAVEAVAQSSTQSERLRSRVGDDLRWLYERHQQEFQQYGLDKTIGELISA